MKCPNCHGNNLTHGDRTKVKVSDGTFFQRPMTCNDCNCVFTVTESYSVFDKTEVDNNAKR